MHHFENEPFPIGGRTIDVPTKRQEFIKESFSKFKENAKICREKYPEKVKMIERFIDSVDPITLEDVFREYAQKSGVSAERFNFVHPDQILIVDEDVIVGEHGVLPPKLSYLPELNAILINCKSVGDIENDLDARIRFLHGLIHEYAHATGANFFRKTLIEDDTKDELQINSSYRSGVDELHQNAFYQGGDPPSVFRMDSGNLHTILNEGITDRVADEALLEYLKRNLSDAALTREKALSFLREYSLVENPYALDRTIVDAVVSGMSITQSIPKETIWRGFIRHYYRGESLLEPELEEALEEATSPEFWETIRNEKDRMQVAEKFRGIFKYHSELVRDWIAYLEQSEGAK